MVYYNQSELKQVLENMGIGAGDTLLIHSSIVALGLIKGVPISEQCQKICDVFLELISDSGTLIVPTFNFDFAKGQTFDRQKTPSKGMGNFSEFIRTHAGAVRSFHPMQSIAAIGKYAIDIAERDTGSSFDPSGPFDRMLDLKSKLVLLGAPMQSASLIHLAEERENVPYRYWKSFSGQYVDSSIEVTKNYKMYVRDLSTNPMLELETLDQLLLSRDLLKVTPLGGSAIRVCNFDDFVQVTRKELQKDPQKFLKKN